MTGRFMLVNDKFCAIAGHPRAALLGGTFQLITHPDDLDADMAYLDQLTRGEIDHYTMEKRYLRADRAIQWVRLTVSIVRGNAAEPGFYVGIIEDIAAQKAAEEGLQTDPLTGLPNRRWLAAELPRMLEEAYRNERPCGVVFIDLDGFKAVNDKFGHEAGDLCLVAVSRALKGLANVQCPAVRLAGDEFVVVCPNLDEAGLRDICARIKREIRAVGVAGAWPIGASLGSAFVPAGRRANAPEVMKVADGMMYVAKRSGGRRHMMTVMPG